MVVTINTKPTQESYVPIPPPPISPLVGAWGDQPWSRGNSEIVQDGAKTLPELNPQSLQQMNAEYSDGEHSEHSAAMTAEQAHDEESPEHSATHDGELAAKQASDYWPEESEVNPLPPAEECTQPITQPDEAFYQNTMGTPYHTGGYTPSSACSCADCMQCYTSHDSGSYGPTGYDTYTHSPYSAQPYHHHQPAAYPGARHHGAHHGYYAAPPPSTGCMCPSCVPPVHQKRVFRYNLPPPPPITADTILQNTPALQHIMFKWYHKVQDIELGPVPPCPPPATEAYDPGYTFHQWMSMVSEWYHTHFFTGRVRRQTSPAPSPRPQPTYTNRWAGY